MAHSLADWDLNNNRVAGSAPAYRIDSRQPRPTDRMPVTSNADRSRKSVAGQQVSPVIPSAHLFNAPGVSDFHGGMGGCRLFLFVCLFVSSFFFFSLSL